MLDVGVVTGVLQGINVDEVTINSIVRILESGMEGLETPPEPVDQAVFGGSYWGGEMGRHTEIAHGKVIKAMEDMLLGLEHYRTGLTRYAAEAIDVDHNVTAAATGLRAELDAAAACLNRPDVRDNPVCTPAPAEEG